MRACLIKFLNTLSKVRTSIDWISCVIRRFNSSISAGSVRNTYLIFQEKLQKKSSGVKSGLLAGYWPLEIKGSSKKSIQQSHHWLQWIGYTLCLAESNSIVQIYSPVIQNWKWICENIQLLSLWWKKLPDNSNLGYGTPYTDLLRMQQCN